MLVNEAWGGGRRRKPRLLKKKKNTQTDFLFAQGSGKQAKSISQIMNIWRRMSAFALSRYVK